MPLSTVVRRHLRALQPASRPTMLPFVPLDPRYLAGQCHANVLHAVREGGGERVFGWVLWEDPRRGFVEGEFHCVLRDSAGTLLDVTPRADGEEQVLFLPDPQRRIVCADGLDLSYPNRPNGPLGEAMAGKRVAMPRTDRLVRLLIELGLPRDQSLA